jgi:hypothetical protein
MERKVADAERRLARPAGVLDLCAATMRSGAPLVGLIPGLLDSVRARVATKATPEGFREPVTFRAA